MSLTLALVETQMIEINDFNVSGLPLVHRAVVPNNLKLGDTFNVYCADGVKLGATWKGDVEKSLIAFSKEHLGYRLMVDSANEAEAPKP